MTDPITWRAPWSGKNELRRLSFDVLVNEGDMMQGWLHGAPADEQDLVAAIRAMPSAARTLLLIDVVEDSSALGQVRNLLLNLLARIHGDGGHHVAKVGVEQACADADEKVVRLQAARDEARSELESARLEIAAWRALAEWRVGESTEMKSRSFNPDRMMPQGKPIMLAEWDYPATWPDDGHMVVFGEGESYGAATVALCHKLGLLPAAAGETGAREKP